MIAVLRAPLLALGFLSAVLAIRAQPVELPPIFAPKPVVPPVGVGPVRPAPKAEGSERMRAQVAERLLAEAKAFDAPAPATGPDAGAEISNRVNADGALEMRRFVVRSLGPPREEVEPPPLPPLLRFWEVERAERRVKPGYSMALARFFGGELRLSVVNGAGLGLDHGRDFTRAEIGFSIRR